MILPVRRVAKPWGRDTLPAPFASSAGERIGEIWFEPPAGLPELLVKYIFTSEKLSVQVHPSDEQTLSAGLGRQGKEECWLVLDADPDARLGIGFAHQLDRDALRQAAIDGSIEKLLVWRPVSRGDFFYIPANTVHAIGAGCTIIEIQQNSDITYRLYDYGRPRELHLDEAIAVAKAGPHCPTLHHHATDTDSLTLVSGPHFLLDQVVGEPNPYTRARYPGALLVIPLERDVVVSGRTVAPGQCAMATGFAETQFATAGRCLLAAPTRQAAPR